MAEDKRAFFLGVSGCTPGHFCVARLFHSESGIYEPKGDSVSHAPRFLAGLPPSLTFSVSSYICLTYDVQGCQLYFTDRIEKMHLFHPLGGRSFSGNFVFNSLLNVLKVDRI